MLPRSAKSICAPRHSSWRSSESARPPRRVITTPKRTISCNRSALICRNWAGDYRHDVPTAKVLGWQKIQTRRACPRSFRRSRSTGLPNRLQSSFMSRLRGAVLVAAAVAALTPANSPLADSCPPDQLIPVLGCRSAAAGQTLYLSIYRSPRLAPTAVK